MSLVQLKTKATTNFPKLVYKKNSLYTKLTTKKEKIAVVGLGYVGLPLAIHMAEKFKVVGFDINESKVMKLIQHKDPCDEFDAIILAVDHDNYKHLAYYDYLKNGNKETLIFDVKGDKKDRFPPSIYMSL